MNHQEPDWPSAIPSRSAFELTRWSLVLAAGGRGTLPTDEALASLCEAYWYPLYAYIRRRGHSPDPAADLTQGFFARLIEGEWLRSVDPAKGRFRSFLLVACKHYLANERDREVAQKRGGGRSPIPIDFRDGEDRYLAEPAHDLTAECLYERRWALNLLEESLNQLGEDYHRLGKGLVYERLKFLLTGDEGTETYALLGTDLGMAETAVKKAAQRLRARYREILRERIAQTVEDVSQVDEEVRSLFSTLSWR
jgi:DNA-directed RNA polymerase specialized sigma24 family protein